MRQAESSAAGYGAGRDRVLVTAERLFGQLGINNVSMRQIAVAAGQANNSAVALHFGSKSGLIEAIIKARRPIIDRAREIRLQNVLATTDQPSLRQLLECLMMPWVDDCDEDGNHPYACFVAQLMWGEEDYVLLTRRDAAPILTDLLARIQACLPHLDEDAFYFRIRSILQLFLSAALHKGRMPLTETRQMDEISVFREIIHLGTAMLLAPIDTAAG